MQIFFIFITMTVLAGVAALAYRTLGQRSITVLRLTIFAVTIEGVLAAKGFFSDFSTVPPHIAGAVFPGLILLIYLSCKKGVPERLRSVPLYWLVAFQSFRVLVEIVLHALVTDGQLAEMMTFTGSNFDIAVGASAPLMALALYKRGQSKTVRQVAVLWNLLGFAILTNTLLHGILSAPTPFQIFMTKPPNTLIGEFPWIWLPGFIVPTALIGHVLSIRQLRSWADGARMSERLIHTANVK